MHVARAMKEPQRLDDIEAVWCEVTEEVPKLRYGVFQKYHDSSGGVPASYRGRKPGKRRPSSGRSCS